MSLSRRFSPISLLLLSINGMIGSAWLFAPLYAAQVAGSGAIISWVIGGLITLAIAFVFAEIATFLPIAGGMARFAQLSHGTLANVLISWVSWLSFLMMAPIEVQATLQYASTYLPWLTYATPGGVGLTHEGLMTATALMLLLCFVNIASFKGLVRVNQWLLTFKLSVLFFTVFAILHAKFAVGNFQGWFPGLNMSSWHAILSAVATGGVVFAFAGFTHGIAMAGEAKNSHIAIPLAVVGSVVACTLIYVLLQIAFIGGLSASDLQNGWQHLNFKDAVGPFIGIGLMLGLTWAVRLLYINSVVSPLGTGLVYVTTTARTVYGISKNGLFPPILSKLNKQGFPIYAIALNFVLGMFVFLPFHGWEQMVNFLVSAIVISYAIGPICLLAFRLQLPDQARPFRLPCHKLFCFVSFYCCNLMTYWTGWGTIWKLAICLSVGFILLMIAYVRGAIDKSRFGMKSLYWMVPYLGGLFILSYLGSYGGINMIPFGWDFLVIAIFSYIVLQLAVFSRQEFADEQYRIYKSELADNKEMQEEDLQNGTILVP